MIEGGVAGLAQVSFRPKTRTVRLLAILVFWISWNNFRNAVKD
jgi:hypothetical protein